MSVKLEYTATNIDKVERAEGIGFFDAVAEMSVPGRAPKISSLVFLLRAGGASDDEINETIAGGLEETSELILKGINDAGFLGQKNKIEVEKVMAEARAKAAKAVSSASDGAK